MLRSMEYVSKIITALIKKGAGKSEISREIGFNRSNMTDIGKGSRQRVDLKSRHLPGLLRLCRKYRVGPQNGNQLVSVIDRELKKEKKDSLQER